ncbi:peptidase inhibitor family I36 protein [Streptomyces paradoxus]|uniref:peptidase inhibitor family I36 protein n=1 Tax=Streptomyces paradoxus TaxID=66375 RepID=UPI0037CE23D9
MKNRKRAIGTMLASVALATAALATAGPTHAETSEARYRAAAVGSVTGTANAAALPHCPDGKICMWSEAHFQGTRYDWSPDQGNVFLGSHGLADKVASFVASVRGCFQDSPPPHPATTRPVNPGDNSSNYDFGRRVDRVKPVC